MGRKEDNNFIHLLSVFFSFTNICSNRVHLRTPPLNAFSLGPPPPPPPPRTGIVFVLHESPQGIWPPVPLTHPLPNQLPLVYFLNRPLP